MAAQPAILSIRQLRRARLVLSLAILIPTLLMTAVGVIMVTRADSGVMIVIGVIVLTLCLAYIAGYVLSSIFLGRGANAALLQADFLSSVSHELRTPLTSIRLLMEALKAQRLTAEEQESVTTLLSQECDRLDGLVGRLLELARLDSGRHAFSRNRIDAAELVKDALASFDAVTITQPTKVTLDLEPSLSFVGDATMLGRALSNLLHNAWKYSGDDKRISLSVRSVGRFVEFVVTDNGIGMIGPEHTLVFERFTRGKAAIDGGRPGVGLGLAFVRSIARAHGGRIRARPKAFGGGSQFILRIKRRLRLRVDASTPSNSPKNKAPV